MEQRGRGDDERARVAGRGVELTSVLAGCVYVAHLSVSERDGARRPNHHI